MSAVICCGTMWKLQGTPMYLADTQGSGTQNFKHYLSSCYNLFKVLFCVTTLLKIAYHQSFQVCKEGT